MTTIARHVTVSGRVQGVWFRAWTKQQADLIGVTGWVRNCDDGSVEAHVEGDPQAVEQMLDRLRRGPPGARVDDCRSREGEAEGGTEFAIRD